ncbi:MAG TPA: hypothetical protein ENI23_16415 [bacterium]|nr:hypothetical protein [bacterium]
MKSLLQKTEEARKLYNEWEEITSVSENIYWSKARILHNWKKNNNYKFVFGDEKQSWASFLSEVHVPQSSADQKVKNWGFFIDSHQLEITSLASADTSCLYYITMYKTSVPKEDVEEWVEKAKVLSRGDFIQSIRGNTECLHDETDEEIVFRCSKCGRRTGKKHGK